jgi:hypothetical protein
MRKIYLICISILVVSGIYAQDLKTTAADKKVMIVSENLPEADAIVKKFMQKIDSMDGIAATHVPLSKVVDGTVTYTDYDAAILTENGGSANMEFYSTAGWPLPTVCLKAYMMSRGDHPLYTQVSGTSWYTSDKSPDLLTGITDMIVKDNSDILKCYTVDQVVPWTAGYNTTIGTGATEAHVQSFNFKDAVNTQAVIVSNATALATNKYLVDNAAVPANLKTFMWKVEENTITKRLVAWGVHHDFLEYATDDFYAILKNSLRWVLKMDISCGGAPNALKDVETRPYQMYPNPVADQLNFSNAGSIFNVDIIDVTGKILINIQNDNTRQLLINTGSLAKGMYFVRVNTLDGETFTDKLVK